MTDGTHFQLRVARLSQGEVYAADIPYTFTNRTGSMVFLYNCHGGFDRRLEMQHAGGWKEIWSSAFCLLLHSDIAIKPDEVYADTASPLISPDTLVPPPHASTQFRIVWHAAHFAEGEDGGKELIPLEERVSNPFTLALPRE
ncbi:MAG: hypothetical protein OXG58_01710 [Gemmatimonadetes bacterium]|nr:hypothetical protein [Gemmatimonadota bacterium]